EDCSGVDVHVVLHPVVKGSVGRHLDTGGGFAPVHTAAAGGEHANVATAADQTGHAHRVVAGCVHITKARCSDWFGVMINRGERGLPALGDGAQALLVNCCQAALFVSV